MSITLASFPLALSVDSALATDHTWNVTGSSNWDIGSNWNGGVPTASGTAIINNSGTAVLGAGVSGTYDTLYTGSSSAGTINITGGLLTGTTAYLGHGAGSLGAANVTSGTWNNSGILYVGSSGTGVLNVNGGYITSVVGVIGTIAGSSGTATVSSGTWSNSGGLVAGLSGTGVLNINGGLVSVVGTVTTGSTATGVGAITLSGSSGNQGVLRTSQIREGLGAGTLDFDGGILQARANHSDFLSGFEAGDVTIGAGGAFIDSNGFAITIAARMDGSGKLTKQGAGTLTLFRQQQLLGRHDREFRHVGGGAQPGGGFGSCECGRRNVRDRRGCLDFQ